MKKGTALVVILVLAAVIAGYFAVKQVTTPNPKPSPQTTTDQTITDSTLYTSKDLKISFNYPKGWYVDEKDFSILIASYKTYIGENKQPTQEQIKIEIDQISLCQDSIDKNLIYGGCGENQKILNKILKKESLDLQGVSIYTYTVQYPDSSIRISRYLQKENKILQVSKNPDPSQYEKEFEEIINSIQFL